jgi:hypothetical protein
MPAAAVAKARPAAKTDRLRNINLVNVIAKVSLATLPSPSPIIGSQYITETLGNVYFSIIYLTILEISYISNN